MRVLIAGHSQRAIGGVQSYERALAEWLLDRGHSPVVYSPLLGAASRELERRTIPVVDDLANVAAPPDVIHGDSSLETVTALQWFPDAPALFVCHGWGGDIARPPRLPRILRYVAVDDTCADRLLLREGIPPERMAVLLNAVDLRRFRRRPPLPPAPRRALVFSNTARETAQLPAIRAACRQAGIELDVIGETSRSSVAAPEEILGRYDLAFAKARCALEAMACGLAVILCDAAGLGGMVRSEDVDRLRRLNFGVRTLARPVDAAALYAEIGRYDPDDARRVSDRIRATASSDLLHESLFALYGQVLEEHAAARPSGAEERRALAVYLAGIGRERAAADAERSLISAAGQRILAAPFAGPILRRLARALGRR
jgi:hypothetical protein